MSYILLAILAIILAKLLDAFIRQIRLKNQMPPGPPGLPWLGNVHQFVQFPWYRFEEWKKQYGPIISLNFAGQPVIVLNEFSVTADLIDRRSAIYSDRPRLIMAGETMARGLLMTLTRYNDLWRSMRKAANDCLTPREIQNYRPMQEMHAYMLLSKVLENTEKWQEQVRFTFCSTLFCAMYGLSPKELHERPHLIDALDTFLHKAAGAALPGTYFVDIFPWMVYLPKWLAPWKRMGQAFYETNTAIFMDLLHEARAKRTSMTATKTLSIDLMQMEDEKILNATESAWLCGTVYTAGMETSATVIESLVLTMVLYPDALRAAQDQIDKVVGRDRLPTFSDLDDLPYVHAVAQEILRWRPPLPLSLPKRCTEDNWYNGYFIPEGTMVMENVWSMNHDPKYFDDPMVFKPERHLDAHGQLLDPIADTHGFSHGSFGAGRRICVGKDLAMQGLLITIAVILWGAEVSPAADDNGDPIIPSAYDLVDMGVVVRPTPFRCSVEPRNPNVRACIDNALGEQYIINN